MALIYIVEDDESIREIEEFALKNAGHMIEGFANAKDFYKKTAQMLPDLVILDIMLPDEDGTEILKKLRQRKETKKLPVIMVTAKTSEIDLIKGLDSGADDYIKKPFSVMELISRVKALLRRAFEEESDILSMDELSLDAQKRVVTVKNAPVELTYKEFELLRILMINQNLVQTRDQLMERIWGADYMGESRTLDMHIKTLRQKLGETGNRIKTVRNVGYKIE